MLGSWGTTLATSTGGAGFKAGGEAGTGLAASGTAVLLGSWGTTLATSTGSVVFKEEAEGDSLAVGTGGAPSEMAVLLGS
ncbi:MAG: hypothetical protein ABSF48_30125 [Thermodesulfobacteriota bacterium]